MTNLLLKFSLMLTLTSSLSLFAQEAPLDPPYKDLIHPRISTELDKSLNEKNDVLELLLLMSPVKSQGHRGTCSIFASSAYLEAKLAQEDSSQKWDLSEEWLEYLAVRGSDDDGSWASRNFYLLKKSGVLRESHWPYDPSEWTEFDELSEKYCGKLKNQEKLYKSCLLIHRDPRLLDASDDELKNEQSELYDLEFLKFKETAPKVRDELNVVFTKNLNYAYSEKEVKALLDQGQPLILGIDFYYGAWNHRLMTEYGIGERNMESWNSGVVGYPSLGSLDREISVKPKNRAGHAIVIIGYDDNVVVTQKIKMKNGHMKTYHYKGVYYFKNSWGADSFGKDMVLEGEKSPGYGMITQRYAHEFGSFTYIE